MKKKSKRKRWCDLSYNHPENENFITINISDTTLKFDNLTCAKFSEKLTFRKKC